MTQTQTIERTDVGVPAPVLDDGDHEKFHHWVLKEKLGDALVDGTPVIALCGKVWVPSKDPTRFPVCPECKRLYELGGEGRQREWESRGE